MIQTPLKPKFSPPKETKSRRWVKIAVRTALGLFLTAIVAVAIIFAVVAKDLPSPGKINSRTIAQSSKIFDRTGEHVLYEIHGEEKRTIVPFDEIPANVKYATLALEDQDFYSHYGIKFSSIARAILKDISVGGRAQGGSTITQQLIKNSLLTSERTFTRKVKEVILALEVEQKFSKNEILSMYLNEIPYGSNAYGIQAASQTFFGKSAKDLTLDEAALLASLPRAPTFYSPFGSNIDKLKKRQEFALDTMAELGFITAQEADEAKKADILSKIQLDTKNISAPHFVMYIKEYLETKYGQKITEEGGLKIYTTLDWDMQQSAERIVKEQALENEKKYTASNASLVAIDPKNGQILSMVGSRDFFDKTVDGQVNVALSDRQPGSSFKPYVYLTAFTKGYTPETYLYDVETNFSNKEGRDYKPQNYNGKFNGPVRMKEALAMSLNIPAVKALYLAGVKDSITTAKSLGITTLNEPERYGLSLVLGGGEVKLLDHTSAYATLANNGIKYDKTGILRIEDSSGNILETYQQGSGVRVIDEKFVAMLDHVLSTNDYRAPVFGENNPLKFNTVPVAAKTGTTNEFRDAWSMGYSRSIAVGVWVGNNDNTPMRVGSDGSVVAAPIWRKFMDETLVKYPIEQFPAYDKDSLRFENDKPLLNGTLDMKEDEKVCEIPGEDDKYCKATRFCPEKSVKKKDFAAAHSILYYVSPSDPLGKKPEKAEKDPQYKNWEKGVEKYYEDDKKFIIGDIPEDDCTEDDFAKFKPSVSVSVPGASGQGEITVSASVDAPYGLVTVQFFANGSKFAERSSAPYEAKYTPTANDNGTSIKFKVSIEDKNGNTADASGETNVSFVP